MIRAWIAYALVVGAFVAAAGLGVEMLCRVMGRPTRWVWALGMGSTLMLVALAPLRRADDGVVAISDETVVASAPAVSARHGTLLELAERARALAARPLDDALVAAARLPGGADHWIEILWLAGGVLLLGVLFAARLRWGMASRHWPVADVQGMRVRVAPDTGPAAVGILAPQIVVPRWLLAVGPEQQRLAIAHEREHLRVRDPLLLTVGLATAVLIPWHPAVWWMLGRLRLCVELDCDARVLRRGRTDVAGYGSVLIDLAERCSAVRLGQLALADGSRHLHRRILAMTSRPSPLAHVRAGAVVVLALAGLVVACETHLPTSAEVARMDVRGAEQQVADRAMFDSVNAYLVDGRIVSREQALAIPPSEIASIMIRRGIVPGTPQCVKNRDGTESCTETVQSHGSEMSIRTRAFAMRAREDSNPRRGEARTAIAMRAPGDTAGAMVTVARGDHMTGRAFDGLIYIDGVRANSAALGALSPREIVSVQILKGAAATKQYADPEAANGVIRVTTTRAQQR